MIEPAQLPPPLRPGERVGVAALSGPLDAERLERGIESLRELGFDPVPARNLGSETRLFAGSDAERLDAFHELCADLSLGAIFFARGGSGVLRLLPEIDWGLLAKRPRSYVGYSDLTPFLLAAVERLGLVTFHGPMVAADMSRGLSETEARSLLGMLRGELPCRLPGSLLRRGRGGEGVLLGGCLTLLVSLLGTPFFPDLHGALLFVEDLGEPLYRLDRMLTHLRLSDNLTALEGLLLGHFGHPETDSETAGAWNELVGEICESFPWPVVRGIPSGHDRPNLTLPLGLRARIEEDGAVSILEPSRVAGAVW